MSACPPPILACILSYLCIPVTLHYKDVFLWHLVYGFLQLIIEVLNVNIRVVSCWGIRLSQAKTKTERLIGTEMQAWKRKREVE